MAFGERDAGSADLLAGTDSQYRAEFAFEEASRDRNRPEDVFDLNRIAGVIANISNRRGDVGVGDR